MYRAAAGAGLALAFAVFAATNVTADGGLLKRQYVAKEAFSKTPDGTPVEIYTLNNAAGATAKVTTYGAILTELRVPDNKGKIGDVVLGFDTLKGYLDGHPYFGSNAGRVANRIAKGRFALDGKEY